MLAMIQIKHLFRKENIPGLCFQKEVGASCIIHVQYTGLIGFPFEHIPNSFHVFKKPEDLMKVPGIKETAFERLKDKIIV